MNEQDKQQFADDTHKRFPLEWGITLRPIVCRKNRAGCENIAVTFLKYLNKEIYPHGKKTLQAVVVIGSDFYGNEDHVHIVISGFPPNKNEDAIFSKMVKVANKIPNIWDEYNKVDKKRFQFLQTEELSYGWARYMADNMTSSDSLLETIYGPVRSQN